VIFSLRFVRHCPAENNLLAADERRLALMKLQG